MSRRREARRQRRIEEQKQPRNLIGIDLAVPPEEIPEGAVVTAEFDGSVHTADGETLAAYCMIKQPAPTVPLTYQSILDAIESIRQERYHAPVEIVSPEEYEWRATRPQATHFDYLLAVNPRFKKWWNRYQKAKWRSRRNQPGKTWRNIR